MKLPKAIRRHKGLAGTLLALLLLAVAAGAVTFANSGQHEQSSENQVEEQQSDEGEPKETSSNSDSNDPESPADALAAVDTSRYKEDMQSYSSDARELQDLLNASIWMNGDSYARFSDGAALVKSKSNQPAEAFPFVLKAVEKSTASSDSTKSSSTVYTAAVEVDGVSGLMTCTRSYSTAVDYDMSATTVTCSALFGNASSYSSQSAAQAFSVAGLSTDALALLGGDLEKIREALETWCRVQAPTATEARWDETLSIDYDAKVVRCPMELNNSSKTKVTVVYDMVGGLFSIKTGSN